MKRSEVIFLIENCLAPYFNVTDTYEKREASEYILKTLIEEAGMLPPWTGKLTTNYGDMGLMSEHIWEPEDGE